MCIIDCCRLLLLLLTWTRRVILLSRGSQLLRRRLDRSDNVHDLLQRLVLLRSYLLSDDGWSDESRPCRRNWLDYRLSDLLLQASGR